MPSTEKKIIIVPDVHGRDAWKKVIPYANKEDYKIIFLGDYHDPYPHEGITPDVSIQNFREIMEFRKSADNVVTLLGNHDLGYLFRDICSCRKDYTNGKEISEFLSENDSLFDVIAEEEIAGRKYSFSHSYVHKSWLEIAVLDLASEEEVKEKGIVGLINSRYHNRDASFIGSLKDVSYYRGGWNSFGSMVWADCREVIDNEELGTEETWSNPLNADKLSLDGYYQVFGHTMLSRTVIRDSWACLDVPGKIFKIEDGTISEL